MHIYNRLDEIVLIRKGYWVWSLNMGLKFPEGGAHSQHFTAFV